MSEYQYYEFQALDKPLSAEEMAQLRSYSTRARITPTSFINHYEWGSFKGDEDVWMLRYFDAFLYLANWGTRVFKLRLPVKQLDLAEGRQYWNKYSFSARVKNGLVVLTYMSEDEEGDDVCESEGVLSSFLSVRAELARGDRRPLYLGWLLAMQAGDLDENQVEPPVPAGLGDLSAPQRALAEFLRIDSDLLHAAAEASAPISKVSPSRKELKAWVATLAPSEKDKLLARVLVEDPLAVSEELNQRFMEKNQPERGNDAAPPRRTIADIRSAAEAYAENRRQIAQREAQERRAKYLSSLAGKEAPLWDDVECLIATKKPRDYDGAVEILVDLRDLAAGAGDFAARLQALRATHARKAAFLDRLAKAGL